MTDIAASSISDWLKNKYDAKHDKVDIIADKLNINRAWLMGYDVSETNSNPPTPTLSNEEEILLKNYNNSNTKEKNIIIDTSFTIVNTYPKTPPREDMIEYLKEFKTAAYGGGKNYYQMNDDELFSLYKELKEDFEDEHNLL